MSQEMTKQWTIVAMQDDAINQARDVIRFVGPTDEPAADIASPAYASDDAILTNIDNHRIKTRSRIRRPVVAMDFVRLPWDQALRVRQMESQNREVYFCPNIDEHTVWMQPFFGNGYEFVRGENGNSAAGSDTFGWVWDDARQTFYDQDAWMQSNTGATPFRVDSPYGIASRPTVEAFANRAAKPRPDSTTTGWSIILGAGTVEYDNETRLPYASDPDTSSTTGGVTLITTDGSSGIGTAAEHTASSLPADDDIGASVLYRTCDDQWQFQLDDAAGTTIDTVSVVADGKWHLAKLQGEQSASGTTASLNASNSDGDARITSIQIGTVFIGEMPHDMSAVTPTGDWPIIDFVPGSQDAYESSYSAGAVFGNSMTISMLVQHTDRTYPLCYIGTIGSSDRIWIRRVDGNDWVGVTVGSGNTEGNTTARTFTQAGIGDGDYYMLTVVLGADGVRSYINGELASAAPSGTPAAVGSISDIKQLGSGTVNRWTEGNGINLFRIDHRPWSAAEVRRHYSTYGAPSGVAYVAPTIGWTMNIESFDFEPYNLDDGRLMVRGRIVLEGMRSTPEFRVAHPDLTRNTDGR